MDALPVLLQPLFIDGGQQLNVLAVLAALHIADGRNMLPGNVFYDVLVGQRLQNLMEYNGLQCCLLGDIGFIHISEICKESAIVAEQGDDDALLVRSAVVKTVQLVAL